MRPEAPSKLLFLVFEGQLWLLLLPLLVGAFSGRSLRLTGRKVLELVHRLNKCQILVRNSRRKT